MTSTLGVMGLNPTKCMNFKSLNLVIVSCVGITLPLGILSHRIEPDNGVDPVIKNDRSVAIRSIFNTSFQVQANFRRSLQMMVTSSFKFQQILKSN